MNSYDVIILWCLVILCLFTLRLATQHRDILKKNNTALKVQLMAQEADLHRAKFFVTEYQRILASKVGKETYLVIRLDIAEKYRAQGGKN